MAAGVELLPRGTGRAKCRTGSSREPKLEKCWLSARRASCAGWGEECGRAGEARSRGERRRGGALVGRWVMVGVLLLVGLQCGDADPQELRFGALRCPRPSTLNPEP